MSKGVIQDVALVRLTAQVDSECPRYVVVFRYTAGHRVVLRHYDDHEKQAAYEWGRKLAAVMELPFTTAESEG